MLYNIYRENVVNCVLKQRLTAVGPFFRNKSHITNFNIVHSRSRFCCTCGTYEFYFVPANSTYSRNYTKEQLFFLTKIEKLESLKFTFDMNSFLEASGSPLAISVSV